ncbi:probable protein phosphatase 2C 64 isoform X1 [Elaeis guineensis]|uniref:protein-serine/threonine phosphatase n=1 Tax=Elaeis guineensis var. tenera TaxID=51953 RepID=A0A8N4IFP9_ELAGV|nr:probable protein phosphatase 2C 64 isoform X1 [Elaeis guineensis]
MGNCQTTGTAAAAARKRRGNGGGTQRGGKSNRSKLPREEYLHLVPGRIFSNEGRSITSSIYTQQGRKGINQDAMILWEDFGVEGGVLCGVFDGHGPHGHVVARKVRDALPLKLLASLPFPGGAARRIGLGCLGRRHAPLAPASEAEEGKENVEDEEEALLSAWREAFVKSYKAMDKELLSHPSLDCFCSGSTAVTLFKLGSKLYMGNIGDSRAVLGSKDDISGSMIALQLTVDLKPDLPSTISISSIQFFCLIELKLVGLYCVPTFAAVLSAAGEAERIKRCRGRVFALQDEPEVPRVWLPFDDAPGLAMARAFGDFCLKDYGVISVPEFFHWMLTERDQFVVLASDGVWDVLSNQEVVDIVSSSPTRSSAAKFLVEAAAREWKLKYPTSKMDDCAVVCLYLDGKMDPDPESAENSTCSVAYCSYEECTNEACETHDQEPTLDRNFTVRSAGNTRISAVVDENRADNMVEDQSWSGLEGVTRVNSLVQLPRFSDEKVTL